MTPKTEINGACNCTASVISSSSIYPADTTNGAFTSSTADPLAPFSNQSVTFRGIWQGGNITVYDYQIDCSIPCRITNVNIEGAAWASSTLAFYNGDKSLLLGSTSTGHPGSVFKSYNIDMNSNTNYLTQFRLVETNSDTHWRYRSLFKLTQIPGMFSEF